MLSFKAFIKENAEALEEAPQDRWQVHFKHKKHGSPIVSAKSSHHAISKAEKIAKKTAADNGHHGIGDPIYHKAVNLSKASTYKSGKK
jgi:hypothetical protein